MSVSQTFVTTPVQAISGTLKRSVSDQFRRLFPAITPFLSLVKGVTLDQYGSPSYTSGLIEKESVETMKFEWFTWTPIGQYMQAASGGASTAVLASAGVATAFVERDGIYNMTKGCFGCVTRINSATLSITTIGATAWNCDANDYLCMCGNMQEEAGATATSRTIEPTQSYNYCQTFRYPISIAETAINSPHYGPSLLERYMTDNTAFALENVERMFFLNDYVSGGTSEVTSVTPYTTGSAVNMYAMRGLINYASATPFNIGGSMTWEKWNKDLLSYIPVTQRSNNKLVMFCGKKIYGDLVNMASSKFIQYVSGDGQKPNEFGVTPKSFQCGPYEIEPRMSNLYDNGGMAATALLLDPTDSVYVYKKGLDMRPVNDIQVPATLGTTRELRGTVSLKVWSAGANILKITNWIA